MKIFHHIGLLTDEKKPGMKYYELLNLWASNPDDNPNKIEWVHFEANGPLINTPVAKMPHISWLVDDLEAELSDKETVVPPTTAREGVRFAYFMDNGALFEYIEYKK
ncbi:MAG: hypothetical protein GY756_16250 [bacterium]|nr:hypothetical protein [bacterium]